MIDSLFSWLINPSMKFKRKTLVLGWSLIFILSTSNCISSGELKLKAVSILSIVVFKIKSSSSLFIFDDMILAIIGSSFIWFINCIICFSKWTKITAFHLRVILFLIGININFFFIEFVFIMFILQFFEDKNFSEIIATSLFILFSDNFFWVIL